MIWPRLMLVAFGALGGALVDRGNGWGYACLLFAVFLAGVQAWPEALRTVDKEDKR
jgi:hypothetical protein